MKESTAKYQIHNTFIITGRGIVLAGNILEGTIHKGDLIRFKFDGEVLERKITRIEGVADSTKKLNTGIMIECLDEKEITSLRNWKPTKIIAEIVKNN